MQCPPLPPGVATSGESCRLSGPPSSRKGDRCEKSAQPGILHIFAQNYHCFPSTQPLQSKQLGMQCPPLPPGVATSGESCRLSGPPSSRKGDRCEKSAQPGILHIFAQNYHSFPSTQPLQSKQLGMQCPPLPPGVATSGESCRLSGPPSSRKGDRCQTSAQPGILHIFAQNYHCFPSTQPLQSKQLGM